MNRLVKQWSTVPTRAAKRFDRALTAVIHDAELLVGTAIEAGAGAVRAVIGSVRTCRDAVRAAVQGVISGITGVASALIGGITASIAAVGRVIGTVVRGVADLAGQLGRDVAAIFRALGHAIVFIILLPGRAARRLGRGVSAIVGRLAGPVIKPIRRMFARQAREEVLGVATTSDHQSHRELILLVLGVVLVGAAALTIASQQTGTAAGSVGLDRLLTALQPRNVLIRLANFSPAQLMAAGAAGLAFLAAVWFWIRMVHDSLVRDFASNTERTKWRLLVFWLFIPGAVAYFLKVYNHWSVRQFVSHHFLSVMVTGVAIVVATSTYGMLSYFNQKAEAQVHGADSGRVPNLEVDPSTKSALLGRTKYGTPLTPGGGGRVDPFAPVPGLNAPATVPVAAPSPSPTPTP